MTAVGVMPVSELASDRETAAAAPYTRANPFPGKLVVNRSLCGSDSAKDTRHFEIDLTDWGLNYEVGDSMTVWPTNDPALVDEIIKTIAMKGDEPVKSPTRETTLREALLRDCRRHHRLCRGADDCGWCDACVRARQ